MCSSVQQTFVSEGPSYKNVCEGDYLPMGFSRILQGGLIPKGGLKCLCVLDHIINTLEVASLGKDVSLKLYIMKSSDELIFNVIFGNV